MTVTGKSVVVVGGGRGLGRGVVLAAREAGARVTAVARELDEADGVQGDATDEGFAEKVLAERRPDLLVITAGAVPEMRPLAGHTWETFSANWHADVRIAFTWLRAAMRQPLAPGSLVVVFGSAAELRGSPLSGGYAGAKATVRMITGYAAAEAKDLGIAMTTVLPVITPGTRIGDTAIRAYAESSGLTSERFTANLPNAPTAASIGRSVVGLAGAAVASAYTADRSGLRPLD
ncbi:SDR family NAD(P)-dependent oxidoreductase [Actinoplanes sp. NPDC051513]|uniref:SDR family NAD(P)-dependent oxidoreductase n=1 Tax=Actinoplanes sp. NPDC051513 TaxID=3363908 RepID=UPI0037AF1193